MLAIRMRNKLIPKPVPLRHELDASLSSRTLPIKNRVAQESAIKKILKKNVDLVIDDKSTTIEEFIKNNSVARFGGQARVLISDMEKRKKISFLLLMYVGKSLNHLEAPYRNVDLSFLVLMGRLNAFAGSIERLTGKRTRIVVATENGLFDRRVLGTGASGSAGSVRQLSRAKEIVKAFGLKRVELKPLSTFLPRNFGSLMDKELHGLMEAPPMKNGEELKEVFNTFLLSFPTKSFRQAVRLYSDKRGLGKIDRWAFRTSLRYLAFLRARYNLDSWKRREKTHIRGTFSPKKGMVNFRYNIGRATPTHGVAVLKRGRINTEHFYDLIKSSEAGGNVTLFKFDGLPFFFRVDKAVKHRQGK